MSNTDTITIDLSGDKHLGTTGQRIDIILPSGLVADLWVFDDGITVSVDVRKRVHGNDLTDHDPLVRSLSIPSVDDLQCLVAVLK